MFLTLLTLDLIKEYVSIFNLSLCQKKNKECYERIIKEETVWIDFSY